MQSMTLEAPRVNVAPALEAAPEVPAENPRDSWPAWTDADRWTTEAPALAGDDESACRVTEDDHREWLARRARSARFAPSAEDDAYASGYYLQYNHATAAEAPAGWGVMRSSAFRLGQADGLLARHRREDEAREEQILHEERMAEAFGEPGEGWHESERVRAVGCIAARMG